MVKNFEDACPLAINFLQEGPHVFRRIRLVLHGSAEILDTNAWPRNGVKIDIKLEEDGLMPLFHASMNTYYIFIESYLSSLCIFQASTQKRKNMQNGEDTALQMKRCLHKVINKN